MGVSQVVVARVVDLLKDILTRYCVLSKLNLVFVQFGFMKLLACGAKVISSSGTSNQMIRNVENLIEVQNNIGSNQEWAKK